MQSSLVLLSCTVQVILLCTLWTGQGHRYIAGTNQKPIKDIITNHNCTGAKPVGAATNSQLSVTKQINRYLINNLFHAAPGFYVFYQQNN